MATASIAARTGRMCLSTGSAAYSSDAQLEVRNIRFRLRHDQLDATSNDSSGWEEFIRGVRGFTATFESLYIPSSALNAHGLVDAILNSYGFSFRFFPTTGATVYSYYGSMNVSDYELAGDSKGIWVNNGTMQGNGPLTYSTASSS